MAEPVITKQNGGKTNWSVLLGAAFIMATSAIGPGFLPREFDTCKTRNYAQSLGVGLFFCQIHG